MKELNIEAPEGYEIDNEKSDLSKGVVRFKQVDKELDYDKICNLLGLGNSQFFIEIDDIVNMSCTPHPATTFVGNESPSKKQLEALLALNKLKNVANYLNGDWKPDWNNVGEDKYYCFFEKNTAILGISALRGLITGSVHFKSPKLAEQAIEILGEDTVKLALSFGSI